MTRARGAWLAGTTLGGVAVILAAANVVLVQMNATARAGVAQRQDYLAQTPQLIRVRQLAAEALAQAAQRNNDTPLRDLLAANGVTINQPIGPAPASAPAPMPADSAPPVAAVQPAVTAPTPEPAPPAPTPPASTPPAPTLPAFTPSAPPPPAPARAPSTHTNGRP